MVAMQIHNQNDGIPSPLRRSTSCVIRYLFFSFLAALMVSMPAPGAGADPEHRIPVEIEAALTPMMSLFSSDQNHPQVDLAALSSIAAFVSSAPEMVSFTPSERQKARGSFIAYNIDRPLSEIMRYTYNRQIPEGAVNPSSKIGRAHV